MSQGRNQTEDWGFVASVSYKTGIVLLLVVLVLVLVLVLVQVLVGLELR